MSRPRGFIDSWNPHKSTLNRLNAVDEILVEYSDYLPLTIRQIYYRLVGKDLIGKTDKEYKNLCEMLNIARRARRISMESIRDDGFSGGFCVYDGYWGTDWFYRDISRIARGYERDKQETQDGIIVALCEAGGMVPQLQKIANPYSVCVKSSGGFDSTTVKHSMGQEWGKFRPITVLHIGDYDPSGECMFDALNEDVMAFAEHYGNRIEFIRIAATADQIKTYQLETKPPKDSSHQQKKGMTETVQAESLDPATLADIFRQAIESRMDMDKFRLVVEMEVQDRKAIINKLQDIGIYVDC